MDFGWSEHQRELYEQTLAFARAELNDDAARREREHLFAREEWRKCGNHGLLGLSAPETYGGLGLDPLTTARVVEAFGRGCVDTGLVFSACAHLFACVMPIVEHGEEDMKADVLAGLCRGETVGANAITEAEAGSDVFSMTTRVRAEGGAFVLDGVKSYVTNGPEADIFLVYATENPAWGHMGISAFVVERDRPGLSVGEAFPKVGLTTSPVSSIYLEDCRVPARNRLGRGGDGARIFTESMMWERGCLFAGYIGALDRQLEQTIRHVRERKQFKKRLSRHQAVAHRVADMKLRLESARLLLYQACWSRGRPGDSTLAVSLAKLAVSEAAVQSSLDALHLHGGLGVMAEAPIERYLRDALPSRIFSGTSEIQRDLIASRLGL